MAALNTSSSSNGDRGVEDLVECPICYAPFDRPLQLSCGHTLCGNCVDKLVEGSRQAPHHNLVMDFGDDAMDLQRLINPFVDRPLIRPLAQDNANLNPQGLGGAQEAAGQAPVVPPHPRYRFPHFPGWDAPYDPIPPPVNRMVRGRMYVGMGGGGGNAGGDGRGTMIKCPECRAQTNVPAAGLPVNYRLQDMIARLNAQSAITGKKVIAKVEVIKCERCEADLTNGCYYTCKNQDCENEGRSKQMCATCGLRFHNGHRIDENRVLTDRDVAEAKESIGLHTARATQAMEQITQKINQLSADATQLFSDRMFESLKVFDNLASSMDGLLFQSVESLSDIQRKADLVASKYEEINITVQDFVDTNKRHFEKFDRQMTDFLREMGLNSRPVVIKEEPASEDDVIVLDNDAMDLRRHTLDQGPGPSNGFASRIQRLTERTRIRHETNRHELLAKRREEHRQARKIEAIRAAAEEAARRLERSRSPSPQLGAMGNEVIRLMRDGTDAERVIAPVTERAARVNRRLQMTLNARRRLEQRQEVDAMMEENAQNRRRDDEAVYNIPIPPSPEPREAVGRRRTLRGRRGELEAPRRKSRRNNPLDEHNVFPEPNSPPPPIPTEPQRSPPRSPSAGFGDDSTGSSSNDAPSAPGPSGLQNNS